MCDGAAIFGELKLFNGHTLGQIIPFIETNKGTLVYMTDLIPVMASIPLSWVPAYDLQRHISLTEKEMFLNDAATNPYILVFEHDLYTECCSVQKTEKGIKINEVFQLDKLGFQL